MSGLLRILLIVSAVLMLLFMLRKIRQSKLKIEYTVFWILFASILTIMGIFPKVFYKISDFIGFQSPISMVFLVVIFVLIIRMFFMTIQISQLENKIDNLVQQIAIDRKTDQDRDEE
ncbi:MAG: DUF2304 domain-containing protein [Dorea sp.]|uniref:DUF2304 domain-containing protein n=1 Tax=Dorea sp. YH-dor226 TaxID=3151119 RepID=UPI003049A88E|nr:DUF2304 domain-containing protein [Dorea sp.]